MSREPVLEGRRKQKIFVEGIDLSQGEQQVPVVDPDSCGILEERPQIQPYPHLQLMYSLLSQKSSQGKA